MTVASSAAPEPPDWFDRTAAWLGKHGALPALGVVTLALCVIYSRVFGGEIAGDDLTFHFAESARIADCLSVGDFDLWNPSANAGFASAYYYQVIPQLASAIPAALSRHHLGHHLFWFQLSVFLPLVLVPAAGYRGMRLMGATPWQAMIAGSLIAFTIGQSRWGHGNDGTFQVGLYTQTWALAAFPLALGHSVRWLEHGNGLAGAVGWGAFVGLCHPFSGVSLAVTLAVAVTAGIIVRLDRTRSWLTAGGCLVVFGLLATRAVLAWGPRLELGLFARGPIVAVLIAIALLSPLAGLVMILRGKPRGSPREAFARWWVEPSRLAVLGPLLLVAALPGWLTLWIDSDGFGGFPHRVDDEVGPGFLELGRWYIGGAIFDFGRWGILSGLLPVVLLAARDRMLRWLWVAGLVFAALLGLGPHMGKTADDLIPPVRFLGAMQIVFALGIGAGAFAIGRVLWRASEDAWTVRTIRRIAPQLDLAAIQFGIRTTVASIAAALIVFTAVGGTPSLVRRLRTLPGDRNSHRAELMQVIAALDAEPDGRKQAGTGATSHWWNLLPYVYARVPALLQMGGGGLQASPNYDFLWTERGIAKDAYLYDAPYVVFAKANAKDMPVGDVVIATEHYEVRRLPSPGLVSPVEITGVLPLDRPGERKAARKAALDWVRGEEPLEDRVLAYAGSGGIFKPPAGKTLRSWRQDSPGDAADIYAEVEATAPTAFMARESWHPRWHAFIDGVPAKVRRVTPYFMAVDVPAGHHVIAYRFERPWWVHAAWLAWPAAALAAWLAMRWRRRPRAR